MNVILPLSVVLLIVLVVAALTAYIVRDVPPENRSAVLTATAAVVTATGGIVAVVVAMLKGST